MAFLDTLHRRKFESQEGLPLCVLRPKDPELALALAEKLIGKTYEEADKPFQGILEQQPYQFLGWMASYTHSVTLSLMKDPDFCNIGAILDENGKFVQCLQEGDSFVTNAFCVPKCFEHSKVVREERRKYPQGAKDCWQALQNIIPLLP